MVTLWSSLVSSGIIWSITTNNETCINHKQVCTNPTKYHIILFKVPHHPLQSTTPPSSKYHIILFKVPHHPLQSTTSFSSKYHTTLFKVPHHPLQSTTPPSSKYHTILFNVPRHAPVLILLKSPDFYLHYFILTEHIYPLL